MVDVFENARKQANEELKTMDRALDMRMEQKMSEQKRPFNETQTAFGTMKAEIDKLIGGLEDAIDIYEPTIELMAKSDAKIDGRPWDALPKLDKMRYLMRSRSAFEIVKKREIDPLNKAIGMAYDYAHDNSTGPEVVDHLWNVRQILSNVM